MIDGATQSRIESIAELLFAPGEQQLVPFLGAGVSLSGRPPSAAAGGPPAFPAPPVVDALLDQLGLEGQARLFLEVAVLVASLISVRQKQPEPSARQFVARLEANPYPPSAGELAEAFCHLSHYSSYEGVARQILERLPQERAQAATPADLAAALRSASCALGVACPPDALTSISSYYEAMNDRPQLWQKLRQIFADKTTPTATHEVLARAARENLADANNEATQDFLIVTTNYDSLMETALDRQDVPYVVLITDRATPPIVHLRLSSKVGDEKLRQKLLDRHSNKAPRNFALSIRQRLAVVYKIHGCLDPAFGREQDGVVISDSDYVNYISQMSSSDGAIPAYVSGLMQDKRLLFLGYSLSDWNVRSVFESVRRKRGENLRDYSVTRGVRDYERVFFDKHKVALVECDLNDFAQHVRQARPPGDPP